MSSAKRKRSMPKPENTFIASVHKFLPVDLYKMKNNNQYNGGIADCWYSGARGDLWIEYKFITIPSRDETLIPLNLSQLQQNWLRARCTEGRSVGVIVGCKSGGVWLPGVTWEACISSKEYRKRVQPRNALATIINDVVA